MFATVSRGASGESDVDALGFKLAVQFAAFEVLNPLVEEGFYLALGLIDGGAKEGLLVVGQGTDAFHESAEFSGFPEKFKFHSAEVVGGSCCIDGGDRFGLDGGDLFHAACYETALIASMTRSMASMRRSSSMVSGGVSRKVRLRVSFVRIPRSTRA